jgi:hypothetical protein
MMKRTKSEVGVDSLIRSLPVRQFILDNGVSITKKIRSLDGVEAESLLNSENPVLVLASLASPLVVFSGRKAISAFWRTHSTQQADSLYSEWDYPGHRLVLIEKVFSPH